MDRETLFQYIEEYLEYQAQQRLENDEECLYNDIETIIEQDIIPELKEDLQEYLGKFK